MTNNLTTHAVDTTTLVELLRYRACYQADRHAYSFLRQGDFEEARLTYGELDQRARSIGTFLQCKGLAGKPVLLLHPPGLEYVASFFGCLYAGAIAVPAYPPYAARNVPRIQAIVDNTQAEIVLTTAETLTTVRRCFEHIPELAHIEWTASDTIPEQLADEWQEPTITPESLAFLQYTSGSTSAPKGVMVSHRNLFHNLEMVRRASQQTPESHMVSWAPPYHDMGMIAGILSPFHIGYPATLMAPLAFLQRPLRWLQAISRLKATMSAAPNFAYDLCVRKTTPEQRAQLDLSSWNTAANGAEPLRAETLQRFAEAFRVSGFRPQAFLPAYGLAEATLISATGTSDQLTISRAFQGSALEQNCPLPTSEDDPDARVLVGYELMAPDQKIRVADPATFASNPEGKVGEIWIAGPSVTSGYWHKPEETHQTFGAYLADTGEGPFLRTGDLGFFYDGLLYPTGRLKDLIIIRGCNYYPQDIEHIVQNAHPAIRSECSVAFSVENDGQEQLIVLAEIDPRWRSKRDIRHTNSDNPTRYPPLDAQEVVAAIRRVVSEQHELQIHHVGLLSAGSILKTSSGKVQRQACRAHFLANDLTLWDEAE